MARVSFPVPLLLHHPRCPSHSKIGKLKNCVLHDVQRRTSREERWFDTCKRQLNKLEWGRGKLCWRGLFERGEKKKSDLYISLYSPNCPPPVLTSDSSCRAKHNLLFKSLSPVSPSNPSTNVPAIGQSCLTTPWTRTEKGFCFSSLSTEIYFAPFVAVL